MHSLPPRRRHERRYYCLRPLQGKYSPYQPKQPQPFNFWFGRRLRRLESREAVALGYEHSALRVRLVLLKDAAVLVQQAPLPEQEASVVSPSASLPPPPACADVKTILIPKVSPPSHPPPLALSTRMYSLPSTPSTEMRPRPEGS